MSGDPLDRARFFLDRRHYARAREEALSAQADGQWDAEAIVIEIEALVGAGLHDEAIGVASQLTARAPDAWWAHAARAFALRAASRPQPALEAARVAVDLAPDEPAAWIELAVDLLVADEEREAWKAASTARALDPDSRDAAMVYGYAALARGDRREARRAFGDLLADDPSDAAAHAALGRVELARFRVGAAADAARDALAIDAEDPVARELHLDAMRARTPVGRVFYGWGAFLAGFPPWARVAMLIGLYFGVQALIHDPLRSMLPTPLIAVIAITWVTFCVITWAGPWLIDQRLRGDPRTTHLFDDDDDDDDWDAPSPRAG